jgi:hypothetical protein
VSRLEGNSGLSCACVATPPITSATHGTASQIPFRRVPV